MKTDPLQTKTSDLHWIEAEDFERSDFAAQAEANQSARNMMDIDAASGGRLVVSFQRPDNYLEYEFREDATVCGTTIAIEITTGTGSRERSAR